MSLQAKYKLLKAVTVGLGAITIPWSTFIGFCFGEGRYRTALIALALEVSLYVLDSLIWWWLMENMARVVSDDSE